MDPALLKERQAFKKRSLAATEVKVARPSPASSSTSKPKPKKTKPKSQLIKNRYKHLQTGINEEIAKAAELAFRNDNPARIFKAVVDLMKDRYLTKVTDPMSLEEILSTIKLSELKKDRRDWLYQTLKNNPKIHYYQEADKFIYLPSLGHDVRNRHKLLHYLQERERDGLGGLGLTDIMDSLPNHQKALKKLGDDIIRIPRGVKDKEEILFYNNKKYELPIDETFVGYWRSIGVDGQSEGDVEKYLQNVGLSAMQGESRKRKGPGMMRKSRKKARQTKVLNTHLDILKDYSEDGTQVTTPTT